VGGKSFKRKKGKKKKKTGWGRGENKVPKKNEKKRKLRSGLRKGKQKNVNLGWRRDRKENPISAPSIHGGSLVGCWFPLP
jgi:hypothetical protein